MQQQFNEQFLRRLEYLFIVARRVFSGQNRGERRSRKVGQGLEFSDHRNYAPGDDLRYLDWAAYGRLGKLLLRLFEEEEDLHVYLLLDTSASMALYGKLEHAAQICAALAYVGLAKLDRVSIASFAGDLGELGTPLRGKGKIFSVFDQLGDLVGAGATNLERSLTQFVKRAKRRGVAIVLSDFCDTKGCETGLNLLRYHQFDTAAIQIIAKEEAAPDLKGDVELVDAESGEIRSVTVSPKVLRAYTEAHAHFCARLEAHCQTSGALYLPAPTEQPFDETVLRFFRRGGLVA